MRRLFLWVFLLSVWPLPLIALIDLCIERVAQLEIEGSDVRKRGIGNLFTDLPTTDNDDYIGVHVTGIEAVQVAIKTGYFPTSKQPDRRDSFFIMPIAKSFTAPEVQSIFGFTSPRQAKTRLGHFAPDLKEASAAATQIYSGATITLGLFAELKIPMENLAPKEFDFGAAIRHIPVDKIDEVLRDPKSWNPTLKDAVQFFQSKGISLESLAEGRKRAEVRKGVILILSKSQVLKSGSIRRGDIDEGIDGSPTDLAITSSGGLPWRSVVGIVPLGPYEKTFELKLKEEAKK